VAELMVKDSALDVPPPGVGLNTVTCAIPGEAMSVFRMEAVNWLLVENVVLRGEPFQFTTDPITKLPPFTVKVKAAPPARALDGESEVRVGKGFGAVTVVATVTELLVVLGSTSVAITLAVLVMLPATVGVTTMVTVALLPLASDPRVQVTVLVPLQAPWLADAETNVTPAGSVSVTVTPEAEDGPLLLTVRV